MEKKRVGLQINILETLVYMTTQSGKLLNISMSDYESSLLDGEDGVSA
jgi:hypothetical protein